MPKPATVRPPDEHLSTLNRIFNQFAAAPASKGRLQKMSLVKKIMDILQKELASPAKKKR